MYKQVLDCGIEATMFAEYDRPSELGVDPSHRRIDQ